MYATPDDILTRYGDTGALLGGYDEAGTPDRARLSQALDEASSEIDMALRGRYRLPIEPVPSVLRRIAVDLAVDGLPRDGLTECDLYERRAKAARELLRALARGEVELGVAPVSAGSSDGIAIWSPPSDFRRDLDNM